MRPPPLRPLLLTFLGLAAVSLVATRMQVSVPLAFSAAVQPVTAMSLGASANLRQAYSTLLVQRELAGRLEALQREHDLALGRTGQLEREVARLQRALAVQRTQAPDVVAIAAIVGVDPSPLFSRFTVNKGELDGVTRFGVATVPAGLVGQVHEVSARRASVITILDPESRVGVTVAGKGGRAIARGQGDRLVAQFSPALPVSPGDVVLTSALGGVFPVGLRVGVIEVVQPMGPNDLERTVTIRPAVDLSVLEEVALLGG